MNQRYMALLGQTETSSSKDGAQIVKRVFNAVRYKRTMDLQSKKLNHSWAANGYKIYPSAVKSLTMCPHRYIHVDVHQPPGFQLENVYAMEKGRQMHSMYQSEILCLPDFLWAKPDYSNYPEALRDEMLATMNGTEEEAGIWPEVPIKCPETGISGRADLVMNVADAPVVVDIKTVNVFDVQKEMVPDPDNPKKKIWSGNWIEGCWKATCEKDLPKTDHKLQVQIYCHLMNKYKVYEKKITEYGIAYVNELVKSGEGYAEFEVYLPYTDEMDEKIALLLKHLAKERSAYLEGRESSCTYPSCREHTKPKKEK